MYAKIHGIPWDGTMTPASNSLPGLPDQQWSTRAWDAYVVAPTMLRPGRPCSAAISAKVTQAQASTTSPGPHTYEVRPRKPVGSKVKYNIKIHQVHTKLLNNCSLGRLKSMQIQETVLGSTDIREKYKPSTANGVTAKLPKLNMGAKAKVDF